MARKKWKLVDHVLNRQYLSKKCAINVTNWLVLKSLVSHSKGLDLQSIKRLDTTKSCSRILSDSGYLIIKSANGPNDLKIYNVNGPNGNVTLSKTVPLSDEWKDRDFGFGPVFTGNTLFKYGHSTHLYFITVKHLRSLDIAKGNISECIALPNHYRYSHLYVDHETCTLAVSSVKNKTGGDILMAFALYDYNPLKLLQLLEVKKSVYGKSLSNVEISQGLILMMHQGHKIKIYSLSSACEAQDEQPPPILFETISFEHNLSLGCNLLCFMRASHYNKFQIHEVATEQILLNGTIEESDDSLSLQICFHPDDTPRLIVANKGTLKLYDIRRATDELELVHSQTYQLEPNSQDDVDRPMVTASGRMIRKRVQAQSIQIDDDDDSILLAWDYEDELNLLGIVYARLEHQGRHQSCKFQSLDLIDGRTGVQLRRIALHDRIVAGFGTPEILLRLDAELAIISFSCGGKSNLVIYRFTSQAD